MEASEPNIWSLRTFCVVTGASQGLGQRMAVRLAEQLPAKSCLLLIARDADGLTSTKSEVEKVRVDILVSIWSVDLSNLDESSAETNVLRYLRESDVSASDFEQLLLVHNAGSLGDVTRSFIQQSNRDELNAYWQLNLTSVIILNSAVLKLFRVDSIQQRVVVNISSLCAKQPYKSWSLYCAGKAAREMLFKTMALEEPDMRILSYSPGPLDTPMQLCARTQSADPEIKATFAAMHAENRLLTCDQTLDRLIAILTENKFVSGSHVDYYERFVD